MGLSFLQPGHPISETDLNTVTERADDITALALDDHSLFYLLGENRTQTRANFVPYLGQVFPFGSGNKLISGYWCSPINTWNYDHSVFTSAVAGASPIAFPNPGNLAVADEGQKWVRIRPLPVAHWTTIGRLKNNANNGDERNSHSLLCFSLEAHRLNYTKADSTVEPFWIQETWSATEGATYGLPKYLQRIHTFDQAELACEGFSGPLEIPFAWNRYHRFRVHNLDAAPLVVNFRAANGSVACTFTIPARGSRCVRRDVIDGVLTYTLGFKYFQRYLPRRQILPLYQHHVATAPPNQNAGQCNIDHPGILIPFFNHVLGGVPMRNPLNGVTMITFAAPTVVLDPHIRAPLPGPVADLKPGQRNYADIFADATNDATLVGDCLHHKGELKNVKTDLANGITATGLTFNGYGTLASLPGVLTQQVGSDLQIKLSGVSGTVFHDFLSLSTNLLCTGENAGALTTPVVDGGTWFTLDRHCPAQREMKVNQTDTPQVVAYNQVGAGGTLGPVVNQTLHNLRLVYGAGADATPLRPPTETIAAAKQKYFGQNATDYTSFTTTTEHTCGGLCIYSTQRIPFTAPFSASPLPIDLSAQDEVTALAGSVWSPFMTWRSHGITDSGTASRPTVRFELDGSTLVIKRVVVFTGYGFPDVDNWFWTGFLTPRNTRVYSDSPISGPAGLPIAGPHPSYIEGAANADGADVKLGPWGVYLPTDLAILTPLNGPNDYRNGILGIIHNPDVLYGASKNVTSGGYWNAGTGALPPYETNRRRCHANYQFNNVPTDGTSYFATFGSPFAIGWYRFVRMRIEVEHLNNIIAKLNSAVRYKALNWIDHGVVQNGSDQVNRYRIRPNSKGIYDVVRAVPGGWYSSIGTAEQQRYNLAVYNQEGLRPKTQFACLELDAPLATIVGYTNIVTKTAADLPGAALFATLEKRSVLSLTPTDAGGTFSEPVAVAYAYTSDVPPRIASVTNTYRLDTETVIPAVQTSEVNQFFLRYDLAQLGTYKWVEEAAVRVYAEASGYQYIPVPCGGPAYKLAALVYPPEARLLKFTCVERWTFVSSTHEQPLTLPAYAAPKSVGEIIGRFGGTVVMQTRMLNFTPDADGDWIVVSGIPVIENELVPDLHNAYSAVPATFPALPPVFHLETQPAYYGVSSTGGSGEGLVGLAGAGDPPTSGNWPKPSSLGPYAVPATQNSVRPTIRNMADVSLGSWRWAAPDTFAAGECGGQIVRSGGLQSLEFTPISGTFDGAKAVRDHGSRIFPFTLGDNAKAVALWCDQTLPIP